MSLLGEWLTPRTLDQFCSNELGRAPVAGTNAGSLRGVLDWGRLARILESGHRDCWLPLGGKLPEESALRSGALTLAQAERGFAEGRTVLVRHAERADGTLARIAADFTAVFAAPIDIQLYATPAGHAGFSWHYDLEDVFVVQSSGEKEFFMRANTVTSRPLPQTLPRDLKFEHERTRQEARATLVGGDWLYVPAGMWHRAEARCDSFHLSVGVLRGATPVSRFG